MTEAAPSTTADGSALAPRHELGELGFRAAMGSFVTGVGIMTSVVDDEPHAMTANSVTSVSLDPLLVLVCVGRTTVMADVVTRGQVFAISFLALDQQELSLRFADPDRPVGAAQFAGVATATVETGAPVLAGASGWLDCEVERILDGGDHLVVIGAVRAVGADEDLPPLAYVRGRYGEVVHAPEG